MSSANFGYKRSFIILDEQDDLYRSDSSKSLTGYVKIEDRGIKTKITLYIQNIKPGKYRAICIFNKSSNTNAVEGAELLVNNSSKAEHITETVSDNIFNNNFSTDDIVGMAIFSYENKKICEGFKEGFKPEEYKIEIKSKSTPVKVNENQPAEHVEDKIIKQQEANKVPELLEEKAAQGMQDKTKDNGIEPKCNCGEKEEFKKNLDLAPIKDLSPVFNDRFRAFKIKPVIDYTDEKSEQYENKYIPFESANPEINWRRENIPLKGNKFTRRLFMDPYLINMIYRYKHYIIGITGEYIVIGIPAKHNNIVNYMIPYTSCCVWADISKKINDYGYWLFFINTRNGNIINIG